MRTLLLAVLGALATAFVLTSYSSGITSTGDATGSPLSNRNCAGCHNGGTFGTDTQVRLLDANGAAVASYVPGETYRLQVEIATTTAPGGYGMQAVVLDARDAQAGAFGTPPSGLRVSARGSVDYVDHTRRLPDAVHEIEWRAPAAGTGTVSVYAVGNAVNGNGGTSGDQPDTGSLTVQEAAAPPTYTQRSIAELRPVDAAGVPTLLGERVEVEGLVYGFDTEPDVNNFNILTDDGAAGLTVLNYSDTLGYAATEGDRVRLRGTVDQVVGLTFLSVEAVELLAQDQPLPSPTDVDELDESLENRLVTFDSLLMVDPDEWRANPTGSYDVRWLRPDGDTLITQVAEGMPAFGEPRPGDGARLYAVTGVVRQFDLDRPFFEGYYLLPRYTTDFVEAMPSSTAEIPDDQLRIVRRDGQVEVSAEAPLARVTIVGVDGRILHEVAIASGAISVKTPVLPLGQALVGVYVELRDGRVRTELVR